MNVGQKEKYEKEITEGVLFFNQGLFDQAFLKFERAHILGQRYVLTHTRVHYWMFRIGLKTRDFREVRGQLLRILLGIVGSTVGIVPTGNSGRSNVSAFAKMPIPDDLKRIMDS